MIALAEVSLEFLMSTFILRPPAVSHASELPLLFGPVPTPIENDFANKFTDYYISFVNNLNPGGGFHAPSYHVGH